MELQRLPDQAPHVYPDDPTGQPPKRRRVASRRYDGFTMHDKKLQGIIHQPDQSRDILPEPVPALLPRPRSSFSFSSGSNLNSVSMLLSDLGTIDTTINSFGMFRRYPGHELPTHDPECEVNLAMLSDIPEIVACDASTSTKASYHPYPNKVSFLLGDWYWNGGSQKSQANFDSLMAIIGDKEFSPESIRDTSWCQINDQLGVNDWDKAEWQDEDAGWHQTSITIQVPFHHLTDNPGAQKFTVDGFYHRSLVSIIQERIRNDARDACHFHFEPFELLWRPSRPGSHTPIRLHGELYTSPAFLDAHNELQSTTREPGCTLPRVIVGLMFWSDATHLTNFGNAKLWPLYMLFGNDSKYQRCRPSGNLCEHVAYFEHVGFSNSIHYCQLS